jgi:hypothetical protein
MGDKLDRIGNVYLDESPEAHEGDGYTSMKHLYD